MNARSFWVYTVLRILFFAVPFALLMLLPIGRQFYWLSAIFAALIGLSLSVLLLRRPLDDVTSALAERRAQRTRRSDEDVEDAALEDAAAENAAAENETVADATAGDATTGAAVVAADSGSGDVSTGPARRSADERPEQERAVGD